MMELFPTAWHMIAVVAAVMGGLLTLMGGLVTLGIWIGKVNADRSSFKEFMTQSRNDMTEIRERLYNISERLSLQPGAAPGSPIRLTNFGKKVSDSLSIAE